jgi:hypothetical protein
MNDQQLAQIDAIQAQLNALKDQIDAENYIYKLPNIPCAEFDRTPEGTQYFSRKEKNVWKTKKRVGDEFDDHYLYRIPKSALA